MIKENKGFSLIELIIVIAVFLILIIFGLPRFLQFIEIARFKIAGFSLVESYKRCRAFPKSTPIIPNIPKVSYQYQTCNDSMSANINDQCSLKINLLTGEKNNWPENYNSCQSRNTIVSNLKNNDNQNTKETNNIASNNSDNPLIYDPPEDCNWDFVMAANYNSKEMPGAHCGTQFYAQCLPENCSYSYSEYCDKKSSTPCEDQLYTLRMTLHDEKGGECKKEIFREPPGSPEREWDSSFCYVNIPRDNNNPDYINYLNWKNNGGKDDTLYKNNINPNPQTHYDGIKMNTF